MQPVVEYSSKRVNLWNNSYICPGPVCSVGDVVQNVRLKHSAPDLPLRWEDTYGELKKKGSYATDGGWYSGATLGLGAETIVTDSYNRGWESRQVGTTYQDMRNNDLAGAQREVPVNQFEWKTQVGEVYQARVAGKRFLPLPGGYMRKGISRGPEPQSSILSGLGAPSDPRYLGLNPQGNQPYNPDVFDSKTEVKLPPKPKIPGGPGDITHDPTPCIRRY